MESVEVEGKTVEEAVNIGIQKMDVSREEISIEILEEGSKGFLGLVKPKNARVRLYLKKKRNTDNVQDTEIKIKEVLAKIFMTLQVQYSIEIEIENKHVKVFIKSPEEGLIIGKRGRNIDAIQHIVNRVINRGLGEDKCKVVIDTSGKYREKKEKNLRDMVHKLSKRVMELKKSITIIPLNPYERRIVHIAAKDLKYVDVESIGEGFYKKMVFKRKRKN